MKKARVVAERFFLSRRLSRTLVVGFGLLCTVAARAKLIVYEGFDYTAADLGGLSGLSGGIDFPSYGWGGAWSHNHQSDDGVSGIDTGSLNSTGVESHGNRLRIYRMATRMISRTVGDEVGTVWLGVFFYATNSKRTACYRLFMDTVNVLTIASKPGSNITFAGVDTGVAATTSKKFYLIRIDFSALGNMAYLWIDPSLSSEPDIATARAVKTYTTQWTFNKVGVENDATTSQAGYFDEIRIGTTFKNAISGTYALPHGTCVSLR